MPQRGWKPADTTVQASAHTGCGNLSPTVEQQISSTGRVAAAIIEIRQFPALAGFRWQLLSAKEEVLKPTVSSGVFCILFAAVGKKYAAGGKKHYVKKKPAGGKKRKATGSISRRRHVLYAKVLLAESHPSEIKTKTSRRRQKAHKKTGG